MSENDKPEAVDETAKYLLRELVMAYSPTWYYEMGKEGYECSFCRQMIRSSADIYKPEHHQKSCALIAARTWLIAQRSRKHD